MSKAEPIHTYEAAVFNLPALSLRPKRGAHGEDADPRNPAVEDAALPAGADQKPAAITQDVIERLIQLLKAG